MSGHSKWSKIKHKKGAADKARSNLFTKLGRAVTVAAQQGGGDPEMNFSLRLAIQKAKAGNMPKDNIERAIKKGTGEGKDAAVFEEIVYEGFGPAGIGILVETLTDNKNRTASEVKYAFSKNGGSLGGPGSVQWQFEHLGVIRIAPSRLSEKNIDKDDVSLQLIDAGADDIVESDDALEVRCQVSAFKKVLDAVQEFGIELDDSGLEWVAKEQVDASDEDMKKVENIYNALDELDDVRDVYMNV